MASAELLARFDRLQGRYVSMTQGPRLTAAYAIQGSRTMDGRRATDLEVQIYADGINRSDSSVSTDGTLMNGVVNTTRQELTQTAAALWETMANGERRRAIDRGGYFDRLIRNGGILPDHLPEGDLRDFANRTLVEADVEFRRVTTTFLPSPARIVSVPASPTPTAVASAPTNTVFGETGLDRGRAVDLASALVAFDRARTAWDAARESLAAQATEVVAKNSGGLSDQQRKVLVNKELRSSLNRADDSTIDSLREPMELLHRAAAAVILASPDLREWVTYGSNADRPLIEGRDVVTEFRELVSEGVLNPYGIADEIESLAKDYALASKASSMVEALAKDIDREARAASDAGMSGAFG